MPIYEYMCDDCFSVCEAYQNYDDDPLIFCTTCGEDTLQRVLYPPTVIDAAPKTLGSIAEKNSGSGRQYWLDSQREKMRRGRGQSASETPWWRPGTTEPNTRLASLTGKEKERYITGEDS